MLTEEQHEIRRKGIGSSEIAAVAGLNPWMGELDVWHRKMGVADDQDNINTRRGNHLEPAIRAWYQAETGRQVEDVGTLVHPEYSIVRATPDGMVPSFPAPLEIKAPHFRTADHWGEPGTDEIPEYYMPQVIWEMAVTDCKCAEIAALLGGDLCIYHVQWDQEMFDLLLERAQAFWHDHIETETPPPPDGSESAKRWLQKRYPIATRDMLQADGEADEWVSRLKEAQHAKKAAEYDEQFAKNRLISMIGDHEGMTGPWGKIYYRNNKDRVVTDWRKLAESLKPSQALIDDHTVTKPGARPFRLYINKA